MRVRFATWLLALCALALSPTVVPMPAAAHATQMALGDCPYHEPPPAHGSDHGMTKHAIGFCCTMAAHAPCLLSAPAASRDLTTTARVPARAGSDLTGHIPQKDPPPPRV